MVNFEFPTQNFQQIKLGIHIAQCAFVFLVFCLGIAVLHGAAKIDGRPGWVFALTFLSIPGLIYLTMTPRFPRTRRFVNPYAMAAVDGIYGVLWISAFASEASYNHSGKCHGACGASKAVIGFGVLIWLLFSCTFMMSAYAVVYFNREGYMPGAPRAPNDSQMIDPDKDAFSSAPHDEYAPVNFNEEHEIHEAGGYHEEPLHAPSGSAYNEPRYDEPTSYAGAGAYQSPQAHEDDHYGSSYDSRHNPFEDREEMKAQFPHGRYDNV